MSYSAKNRLKKRLQRHRVIAVALIVCLVAVATLAILELTHVIHLFHTAPAKATIPTSSVHAGTSSPAAASKSSGTTSKPATSSTTTGASSGTSSEKGATTSTTPGTTATLIAPWGSFVSNHSPGKNGSPTTEVSVCDTTPGATCYIQFTMGSYTRTLSSQTADSTGAISWSWDVSNPAFPAGSWQITAIATLNGQTKTTQDSQPLEVQP